MARRTCQQRNNPQSGRFSSSASARRSVVSAWGAVRFRFEECRTGEPGSLRRSVNQETLQDELRACLILTPE
jgi:hypothetical protein